MVNERYSMAMAETLHYLKGISQEDISKIPNKFMEFIKANASKNYECKFDYSKPLRELELLNETRGLIATICLNYWCETEEQKNCFVKHLTENEKRYQEELSKRYNMDNIFKKKEATTLNAVESMNTNNLPAKIEKENIVKRIFNYIMKLLNIKK